MKRRTFGFVAGNGSHAVRAPDPSTSAGLVTISRERGPVAAMAASAEHAMRTGTKQEVSLVTHNGAAYVRLAKDEPKDPRTPKQQEADRWVKEHGINVPIPGPGRWR